VEPKEYANTLHEDLKLRKTLMNCPEAKGAEIADIEIIRHPQRITVIILPPGLVSL
jgi:small subunit ribosomal protein S3